MRITTKQFFALNGSELGSRHELKGWIHRIRAFGGITFIVLRDRAGIMQLTLENGMTAITAADIATTVIDGQAGADSDPATQLTPESVIAVSGVGVLNPKAPGGRELRVETLTVLSRARTDLPFPVNDENLRARLDHVLDQRPISLRHRKIRAIFAVQSTIIAAFAEYLRGLDFTEIKTSKLIGGMTEGGTGLFEVAYFDTKVYLAQSPQFYKQTMVASGLERVFEIAPAYRAEKHDTPRHLNEYVSMDVELAFIDSELDLIDLERGLLSHIFRRVGERNAEELALWDACVPDAAAVAAAPVIAYAEALTIAAAERAAVERATAGPAGNLKAPYSFHDINPEAEKLLCAWAAREKGSELVFVNEFPRRERPFYTYPMDASRTHSFDALFRGLEITTGGRRINDYDQMLATLPKFGLNPEPLTDYLAIFKYGCPPHGGFALGLERVTQKILGLANVKEASLFPRDRKRISP